ncbi:hypothetical protein BDZ89DRAFT_1037160 [Hymenopellis radicata]|nr:hypothetical protein BDZ89DRAFT_1037160 [Hymenopellis radicata]
MPRRPTGPPRPTPSKEAVAKHLREAHCRVAELETKLKIIRSKIQDLRDHRETQHQCPICQQLNTCPYMNSSTCPPPRALLKKKKNDIPAIVTSIAKLRISRLGTVFEILKIPSNPVGNPVPWCAWKLLAHSEPSNLSVITSLSATSSCVAAANMSSTTTASSAVVSSLHILKDRSQRREASLSSQILARAQRGSIACRGLAWFDKICSSELLYRKHIFSSVFEAYQSREFLGMQTIHLIVRKEYARLSCSFSEQGIKIWTVRMWASTAWFLIAPQDRGGAGPKNALDGPAGGREEAYSHARGLACLVSLDALFYYSHEVSRCDTTALVLSKFENQLILFKGVPDLESDTPASVPGQAKVGLGPVIHKSVIDKFLIKVALKTLIGLPRQRRDHVHLLYMNRKSEFHCLQTAQNAKEYIGSKELRRRAKRTFDSWRPQFALFASHQHVLQLSHCRWKTVVLASRWHRPRSAYENLGQSRFSTDFCTGFLEKHGPPPSVPNLCVSSSAIESSEQYQTLQPTIPFKPKRRSARHPETAIEPGVKAPSLGLCHTYPRKPEDRFGGRVGDRGQEENENLTTLASNADQGVYSRFFKHLIWLEEYKASQDLEHYDITGAKLTNYNQYKGLPTKLANAFGLVAILYFSNDTGMTRYCLRQAPPCRPSSTPPDTTSRTNSDITPHKPTTIASVPTESPTTSPGSPPASSPTGQPTTVTRVPTETSTTSPASSPAGEHTSLIISTPVPPVLLFTPTTIVCAPDAGVTTKPSFSLIFTDTVLRSLDVHLAVDPTHDASGTDGGGPGGGLPFGVSSGSRTLGAIPTIGVGRGHDAGGLPDNARQLCVWISIPQPVIVLRVLALATEIRDGAHSPLTMRPGNSVDDTSLWNRSSGFVSINSESRYSMTSLLSMESGQDVFLQPPREDSPAPPVTTEPEASCWLPRGGVIETGQGQRTYRDGVASLYSGVMADMDMGNTVNGHMERRR